MQLSFGAWAEENCAARRMDIMISLVYLPSSIPNKVGRKGAHRQTNFSGLPLRALYSRKNPSKLLSVI